jgi:hypothetical protein
MNIILTKEIVTKRVFRVSILLTIALVIWHLTLLKSDAPYINCITSWIMTLISPFLACVGIHTIVIMYQKWFGSKAAGEAIQAGGGDLFLNISGHSVEAFIAVLALVILLPIIVFVIPSGVLVIIAYQKQNIWQMIVDNLTQYTTKEEIFIGVVAIFFSLGLAVIVWECIVVGFKLFYKSIKWAWVK